MDEEVLRSPRQLARVADYLVGTSENRRGPEPAGSQGPVVIADRIRFEAVDDDMATRLLRATEPSGENWSPPAGPSVMHAYVRDVWTRGEGQPEQLYSWDPDGRLYACLVLSRLVRDNATSCRHAVRRLATEGGDERLIPLSAFDSHVAYRLHPETHGWLDVDDAATLASLIAAYDEGKHPNRVAVALRRAEAVSRERFLQDGLPLTVGAVEALLKVGRDYARAIRATHTCGRSRIRHRANDRPVEAAYDDRSALVHGAPVDLSEPHKRSDFEDGFVAVHETLRATIRRALLDPAFGKVFADDDQIRSRWPTAVPSRAGTRRL